MAKTATTTTVSNNNVVTTLNTLKGLVAQTAATLFESYTDVKQIKLTANEIMNGFITAIKEQAQLRIDSIGDVKPTAAPAPTTKATAKTAKAAAPKATKTAKAEPKTKTAKATKAKTTKAEREAAADAAAATLMASKKELKKLGLKFVAYKESQLITGDTKPIKDSLKALQTSQWGVYCFRNAEGFNWAVNNKTADKVAKVLGIRYKKAQ